MDSENKIKVVHLIEALEVGGIEKIIITFLKGIDLNKFDPEVWCFVRKGEMFKELKGKQKMVKVLNMNSYFNPFNIFRLSNLLKENKVEIIHSHTYFTNTFSRLSALMCGIKIIIVHIHSTYWNYSKRNLFIEKILSKFTNKLICCSEAVKNFVINVEGIDVEKTCVIYNGVEDLHCKEGSNSIRKSLGLSENDFLIAAVGSLNPHKGHKELLEIMSKIIIEDRCCKLILVGDGQLKDSLQQYAMSLNIDDNVYFLGIRHDVQNILKDIDIFVHPTLEREGLGISIIEAMICSKPVVAFATGGVVEVIDQGESGYLVKDKNEFKEKVERLKANVLLRKKMGEKGRKIYMSKFTSKQMIDNLENLYLELLEK